MDKKVKSILLLSFLLVLLFMPMASAGTKRQGDRCVAGQNQCGVGLKCNPALHSWERYGRCEARAPVASVTPIGFFDIVWSGVSRTGAWLVGYNTDANWIIAYIIIFIMLSFAFRDIISLFPIFENTTNWVLGFGFAAIAALIGGVNTLITKFYSAVAMFGAFTVGVSVFLMFLAFAGAHFMGEWWLFRKLREMKTVKEIRKAKEEGKKRGGQIAAVHDMAEEALGAGKRGLGWLRGGG